MHGIQLRMYVDMQIYVLYSPSHVSASTQAPPFNTCPSGQKQPSAQSGEHSGGDSKLEQVG